MKWCVLEQAAVKFLDLDSAAIEDLMAEAMTAKSGARSLFRSQQ